MSDYSVPYTFIAGTRAKASQVNANFEYVDDSLKSLDDSKAALSGNAAYNFSVAEPSQSYHAATKRYVDLAIQNSGGGGSGVGKSMFEVFHTLSTQTPAGAFSLRTGEVLLDAKGTYPAFWDAVVEQSKSLIPDFTDIATSSLPDGYTATFTNVVSSDEAYKLRAFSPFSWFTSEEAPSSAKPVVAELELPSLITCSHFRINSHVIDSYNSTGTASSGKAIKVASISIRQADDTWVPVTLINETEAPTSNERYFENSKPDLEFNAIRIVIAENFGADALDISVYPFNPEKTSIRVVPEKQWQWEVETFNETGSFVIDEENETIRLPKITRLLSGVSELWQVGMPESNYVSKSGLRWQEGSSTTTEDETDETTGTISLDAVSTGLWIQVYNTVGEDALANIRYIPHAVLFEERPFRFIPDQETGWAVSDGNWKDGAYYTAALTELSNEYASSVAVSNKDYKISPKGMRFVSDSVYTSTYAKYGEAPYYVLDVDNSRFKTPISDNYIRYTHTLDNANELILDSAPEISGTFPGTEGIDSQSDVDEATGAFYKYSENTENGDNDNSTYDNNRYGFQASRSSEVYGRADEVRPKSAYYLMCVFLGNEIPDSTAVDVLYKVSAQDERISALEDSASTSAEGLALIINQVKASVETNTEDISSLSESLETMQTDVDNLNSSVEDLNDAITSLNSKDTLTNTELTALTERVTSAETNIDTLQEDVLKVNQTASDASSRITDAETILEQQSASIQEISATATSTENGLTSLQEIVDEIQQTTLPTKADISYVNTELAKKQVKLQPSSDFTLDEEGNLALASTTPDTYTKDEVDSALALKADQTAVDEALALKADKTELSSYATSDALDTLSTNVSNIQTSLNGFSFWSGTQEEYDALTEKDANTLYIITGA